MTYTHYHLCWSEKEHPQKEDNFGWFTIHNLTVFDFDQMIRDYEEANVLCNFWIEYR